jgi:hypothetical protein
MQLPIRAVGCYGDTWVERSEAASVPKVVKNLNKTGRDAACQSFSAFPPNMMICLKKVRLKDRALQDRRLCNASP